MSKIKKLLNYCLAFISAVSFTCCSRKTGESLIESAERESIQSTNLPDYDKEEADEMIFTGWYSPTVSEESFRLYKDCGFNRMFLQGLEVGGLGDPKMQEALTLCDNLGIGAMIDVTQSEDLIIPLLDSFTAHKSFMGFNYDEPVIYRNTLNNRAGIIDLSAYVKGIIQKKSDVEFLVNLNPTMAISYPWGTPPFTYDEYIDAQLLYINEAYINSTCHNWLSCDDYPLCYNTTVKNPYYLKRAWLQNLEYLANAKRDSDFPLSTNFFIQSMPLGTDKNRVPTYEDLRLQIYTLMAFGYDSVSFFCYQTPPKTGEFDMEQYALIDRNGNKTEIYDSSKKIINEIQNFSHVYMQFNDNCLGIYPILGSNNLENDDMYYNLSYDNLLDPITNMRDLIKIKSVTATEDTIVGCMVDKNNNPGYMFVNYNDTYYKKTSTVEVCFNRSNKALVFRNGVKTVETLVDGKLNFPLGVGEGVFVIPYAE